jgi:hypothetical protein
MALKFPSDVEAWDSRRTIVTFLAADAGTEAPIVCAVTREALVASFEAHPADVPGLIQTFRQYRDIIESVASITYDLAGRRGPVILRSGDFAGRTRRKTIH